MASTSPRHARYRPAMKAPYPTSRSTAWQSPLPTVSKQPVSNRHTTLKRVRERGESKPAGHENGKPPSRRKSFRGNHGRPLHELWLGAADHDEEQRERSGITSATLDEFPEGRSRDGIERLGCDLPDEDEQEERRNGSE